MFTLSKIHLMHDIAKVIEPGGYFAPKERVDHREFSNVQEEEIKLYLFLMIFWVERSQKISKFLTTCLKVIVNSTSYFLENGFPPMTIIASPQDIYTIGERQLSPVSSTSVLRRSVELTPLSRHAVLKWYI